MADPNIANGAPPLTAPWVHDSIPNEEVLKHVEEWNDQLHIIIKHMGNPSVWALHYTYPPLKHYVRDGVVLVGYAVRYQNAVLLFLRLAH